MGAKEVRVECPRCHSLLEVDVLTEKVLRVHDLGGAAKQGAHDAGWSAAAARVQDRMRSAADKLEESLEREKGRAREIDDLFDKAADKLKRRKDADEQG